MELSITPPLAHAHVELFIVFPVDEESTPTFDLVLSGPGKQQVYAGVFHSVIYLNEVRTCSCRIVLASPDNVTLLSSLLSSTLSLTSSVDPVAEGKISIIAQASKRGEINVSASLVTNTET